MATTPDHRDADIDTVRGVAALGVMAFHLRPSGQLTVPGWLAPLLDLGSLGVPLFFALSAYLLTALMPAYLARRRPVATFYVRRFFRVAPLFYAVLVLWGVWFILKREPLGPDEIAWTVSLLFGLNPAYAEARAVFAGWTVGVEVLFYLLFPLLYLLRRDWRLLAGALLLALLGSAAFGPFARDLAQAGMTHDSFYLQAFPIYLPTFLMGMLASIAFDRLSAHPWRRPLGLLLMLLAGMLIAILTWSQVLPQPWQWRGVAVTLFLLGYLLCPVPIGRSVTSFLGRISYSIYLLHGPIIMLMRPAFAAIYAELTDPALAFAACSAATLAIVLPVAWLSYRLIEQPGIALGKHLAQTLNRPRPETKAA